MKRLVTAIAVGLLLMASAGAQASWIGNGASGNWNLTGNWSGGSVPTSGTVVIDAANLQGTQRTAIWNYSILYSHTFSSIDVVSDDNDAMTLQKSGAGSLNAGDLTLEGYTSLSYLATLAVDASMSASSTTVKNYVDIDVASSKTFTAGTMSIGDTNSYSATLTVSGTGTLDASSTYIDAGPSSATSVTISGTTVTGGPLTITGSTYYGVTVTVSNNGSFSSN